MVLKFLYHPLPKFVDNGQCFFQTKLLTLLWFHVFFTRSEEHTSELQSRGHLVCRLLLEKKKIPWDQIGEGRSGKVTCPKKNNQSITSVGELLREKKQTGRGECTYSVR